MSQTPVIKLKELLFEKESREIDTLSARVDELLLRTGSDERLRASVARVLEGAIREAEAERHRELADALAPVVVRTVRSEIVSPDTQDKIAGSLYTKIGEMVRRYVASAMRDLLESINRRLESGLTANRFMLRMRSVFTGRSMAELALASTERLRVEEVYLIRRGSGELVRHWYASPEASELEGGNRDTLISGFLTAITAFAEEAFEAEKSSLRALDLDAHRVFLRGSPTHLVAVKCRGATPGEIEALLDAEMIRLLDEHGQLEERARAETAGGVPSDPGARRGAYDRILAEFAQRFEHGVDARGLSNQSGGSFGIVKVLAVLIALPILAYIAWTTWQGYRAGVLQAGADEIVDRLTALRGYPIGIRVDAGGKVIHVHGLTPSEEVRTKLRQELGKLDSGVVIRDFLAVVPQADPTGAIRGAALRASLLRAEQGLGRLAIDLDRLSPRSGDEPESAAVIQRLRDLVSRSRAEFAGKKADELVVLDDAGIGQKLAPILSGLTEGEQALARLVKVAGVEATPATARGAREGAAGVDLVPAAAERLSRLLLAHEVSRRAAAEQARITSELAARLASLSERLEILTRPSTRQRLETYIASHAVFFANATDYRDPAGTAAVLDQLAKLILEASDVLVRVVGYTDDLGGQQSQRNLGLSQQRADMIVEELARRGVPRTRLVAVGRATNQDLAPRSAAGATPVNRRVEFEIGFRGEDSIKP